MAKVVGVRRGRRLVVEEDEEDNRWDVFLFVEDGRRGGLTALLTMFQSPPPDALPLLLFSPDTAGPTDQTIPCIHYLSFSATATSSRL